MNLSFLQDIGLSRGEIKVYHSLLATGKATVNNIHESVGIERRNIYDILNKLTEKGLITYTTENKHRLFSVAHPSKILGYIHEKKQEWERTEETVLAQIPAFLSVYDEKRPPIDGQIFRGGEGIKAVWEEMLDADAIYWVGSGRYVIKKFPQWFSGWNRKRVEKKVWMHNLIRHELRKEISQPFQLEKIKFLPKDFSKNPTVICIFGNKVANFIFTGDYFAFVIESQELAENYKAYHQYLWDKVAKP